MNILIVAEFLGDIENPDTFNSRFLDVADVLVEKGHMVKIVTTNYMHHLKKHASNVTKYKDCDLITLNEPGYKKNISLKRFYSHYMLSKELKNWLATMTYVPDVIYCAVPSLDFAYEAAKYAKSKGIKFVLDVQDLWPEAFEMVINIPMLSSIIFTPFRRKANYIYSCADKIIAVSQTFIDRVLKSNIKCRDGVVVYLGTDLKKFDEYKINDPLIRKKTNEIWLTYVGTLGYSYDLKTVMDALQQMKGKSYYDSLKFIVMGDGPLRTEFETYADKLGVNVEFLGMLPYPQMVPVLCESDIVVNPIKRNSAGTIINKHADYAASGIPVINTQESEEYRELINSWKMGINCECQNSKDVSNGLSYLIENEHDRVEFGGNARKCALEKFDRNRSYKNIYTAIINV